MALDVTLYSGMDADAVGAIVHRFVAELGDDAAAIFAQAREADRITKDVAADLGAPFVPASWALVRLDKAQIPKAKDQVRGLIGRIAAQSSVFAVLEGETPFD